jgi:hypothetical protein
MEGRLTTLDLGNLIEDHNLAACKLVINHSDFEEW